MARADGNGPIDNLESLLDFEVDPILNNIRPINNRDPKNYEDWTGGATVKLCTVNWDNDYESINQFANKAARDSYLNALPEVASDLVQTNYKLRFNGATTTVRVPFDYDLCLTGNYLVVDLNATNLPYDGAPSRYCFFVEDYRQHAPNTTELTITLDLFQNFFYDTDINFMHLDRGHVPMKWHTPTGFLSNPRVNNEGLLTPEGITGSLVNKTWGQEEDINTHGYDMAYIIAFTGDYENGEGMSTPNVEQAFFDYASAPQDVNYLAIEIQAGLTETDVQFWFDNMYAQRPEFVQTILYGMYVPKKWVTLDLPSSSGHQDTFCGYNVWFPISASGTALEFDLTPDKFNYPAPYNKITKLYTGQYAIVRTYIDSHSQVSGNTPTQDYMIEQCEHSVYLRYFTSLIKPDTSINFRTIGLSPVAGNGLMLGKYGIATYQMYDTAYNQKTVQEAYSRAQNIINANRDNGTEIANAGRTYNAAITAANNNFDNRTAEQVRSEDLEAADVKTQANNYLNAASRIDNDERDDILMAEAARDAANNLTTKTASVTQGVGMSSALLGGVSSAFGSAVGKGGMGSIASAGGQIGSAAIAAIGTGANAGFVVQNANDMETASVLTLQRKNNNLDAYNAQSRNIAIDNINETQEADFKYIGRTATNDLNTATTNATKDQNNAIAEANTKLADTLGNVQAAWDDTKGRPAVPSAFSNEGETADAQICEGQVGNMIITAAPDIVKRAGIEFCRFGYNYSGMIDMNGVNPQLQIMSDFTYYNCSDIILTNRTVPQNFKEGLENIFKRGTTIYNDPDKIRATNPLDNIALLTL